MSFISTSVHQKFVSHCNKLVSDAAENTGDHAEEMNKQLISDLAKLQQLAGDYLDKLSALSQLSNEYYILQRHIRINMRKLQLVKTNK